MCSCQAWLLVIVGENANDIHHNNGVLCHREFQVQQRSAISQQWQSSLACSKQFTEPLKAAALIATLALKRLCQMPMSTLAGLQHGDINALGLC